MSKITPEILTNRVIRWCAECGLCRELMEDAPCQFLPYLFKLQDHKRAGGGEPTPEKLRHLVELCNSCGRCPCDHIQAKIREAKAAFIERDGLPLTVRFIEDVRLMGRLCGALPQVANLLMQNEPTAGLLKRAFGIHPERTLPKFPRKSFDTWAKARRITGMRESTGRKVAYFAGCTARYLFPEVAKATVEVLEHNGVSVYLPEQRCCGIPTMLEGDRAFTLDLVGFNLPELQRCIDAGYDIVSSCPTCSYMLKSVLRTGAVLAEDYRAHVKAIASEMSGDLAKVQDRLKQELKEPTGRVNKESAGCWEPRLLAVIRWMRQGKDDGYFASIKGMDRIGVATHTYELGEYLHEMQQAGELKTDFGPVSARMAYFPPCHRREMKLDTQWMEVLACMPGVHMEMVGDFFDCCGLGGIMGFKKQFHKVSLAMGRPLMDKIQAMEPDQVVTDCLSCRLQFNQMLPYEVVHPVEILRNAYRNGSS